MSETMDSQQPVQVRVTTIGQYIKKLSFDSLKDRQELAKLATQQPTITFNIATKHEQIGDTEHEVVLLIDTVSKIGEKNEEIFKLQLEYAGIFKLEGEGEIEQSVKDEILLVNCITLLFPFARREIAAITLGAGYQPLILEPIDFRSAYLQYKQTLANENEKPMPTNEAANSSH